MPIYEYRCRACGRKSQFLTLSAGAAYEAKCRGCGGTDLEKLVSRVAIHRSEEGRMDDLSDSSRLGDLDEKDPRAVAKWMKKMGKEMGEGAGEDFEEEIDRAVEEADGGEDQDDLPPDPT